MSDFLKIIDRAVSDIRFSHNTRKWLDEMSTNQFAQLLADYIESDEIGFIDFVVESYSEEQSKYL